MLEHAREAIATVMNGISEITFIPYARPDGLSHEEYTAKIRPGLEAFGFSVRGIESYDDPKEGIASAEAIFVGGGNTFVLVRDMYANGLLDPIRDRVKNGMPYMGSSAGSNLAGLSCGTTNDMPIVYPPSFDTLQLVPFNINPHYPKSELTGHFGETRDQRINEFHFYNEQPVIALREDSALQVTDGKVTLHGNSPARIFEAGKEARDLDPSSDFQFLMG